MRFFQGIIELAIFLILLGVALWWSWFCFSKGYTLGKNGTENYFADWAIELMLGDAAEQSDDEDPSPKPNALEWIEHLFENTNEL